MPNFEEVAQTENNVTDEKDAQAGETVQTLELTEGQIEQYTAYEAMVDTGRYASALLKETGDDRFEAVVDWSVEKKEELRKECKEFPGNLPMFRAAFPVEDRSDLVWVLVESEAAKVGIDYDSEDYIALPIYDGVKWSPRDAIDGEAEAEIEEDEKAAESGEAGVIDPRNLTVAELKAAISNVEDVDTLRAILNGEADGKRRKTAVAALNKRIAAVQDSENDADEESDDSENVEDSEAASDVDAAKVEALKALTETLNNVNDTLKSL